MRKLLLVIVAAVAMLPAIGAARGRVGVFVGPGFAPYGWYGGYGPGYGFYPSGPYGTPNAGEVKIDTKVKDAEVLINGSLAGTVGQLKTMILRAGTYDVQVRAPGRAPFEQKIYVVAGKTVKLRPDLSVVNTPGS
jgi:opacity protein-like surface antigen